MKTLLIATALVATSFAASAEYKGIPYEPGVATASAHQARTAATAQNTTATQTGRMAFSESAMRAAERKAVQASLSVPGQAAPSATVAWGEPASAYSPDGQ